MGEQLTGVNGGIIRWAREYYHMDEMTAATAIGIDVERYKNWESGQEHPTYAMLKKISNVFRKPSAVFFFPVPPEIPSINGELRTLPHSIVDRFSKNIIIQYEKARVQQMSLRELYGHRDSLLQHPEQLPTDISALCGFLRDKMMFPVAAQKARKNTKVVFEVFREKFYELGIYVFKDSFRDETISGLCVFDKEYPVIVINNAMSFARQIFTMFHELYHLLSETSGVEIIRDDYFGQLDPYQKDIESKCDSFANMFLVPPDDFIKELSKVRVNEESIVDLATLYSVSREAIMYKLWKMGRISSDEYTELKEVFYGEALRNSGTMKKKESGGGNFYATQLAYLGRQYTGDVFKQYFAGKIDSVHASHLLQSKVDHLPNLERAFFRGVK